MSDLENAKITTNGDKPAVELPNGERLTLNVFINEIADVPAPEAPIEYETETYTEDYTWWHLATDSDLEVVITPEISTAGESE